MERMGFNIGGSVLCVRVCVSWGGVVVHGLRGRAVVKTLVPGPERRSRNQPFPRLVLSFLRWARYDAKREQTGQQCALGPKSLAFTV